MCTGVMKSCVPGVVLELEEVVEASDALLGPWTLTAVLTLRVARALCEKTETEQFPQMRSDA